MRALLSSASRLKAVIGLELMLGSASDRLRAFDLSLLKVRLQGEATCQEAHGHGLR